MGLLLSDTVLIDPLLDETSWSRYVVGAWAYELDAVSDPYDNEATEPAA